MWEPNRRTNYWDGDWAWYWPMAFVPLLYHVCVWWKVSCAYLTRAESFHIWNAIDFVSLWGYSQLTEGSAWNPLLTLWMGSNKTFTFYCIDNNSRTVIFPFFQWHHFISSLFYTWIGPEESEITFWNITHCSRFTRHMPFNIHSESTYIWDGF